MGWFLIDEGVDAVAFGWVGRVVVGRGVVGRGEGAAGRFGGVGRVAATPTGLIGRDAGVRDCSRAMGVVSGSSPARWDGAPGMQNRSRLDRPARPANCPAVATTATCEVRRGCSPDPQGQARQAQRIRLRAEAEDAKQSTSSAGCGYDRRCASPSCYPVLLLWTSQSHGTRGLSNSSSLARTLVSAWREAMSSVRASRSAA
jgi:hypothetical protein